MGDSKKYLPETVRMFENMDNGAYNKDPEKGGTELDVVRKVETSHRSKHLPTSTNATSLINGAPSTSTSARPCKPEVCEAAKVKYSPPDLRGNPWSRNKSIFLGVVIVLLVVWIITYSTLSKLNML